MQTSHRPVQFFAVMLLIVSTSGQCEQNKSRRAVTEHQLMHDRGQNIQSLKRLIWLSSAIEGLHTAQTRSGNFNPPKTLNLVPAAEDPQTSRVQSVLRDFFNNHYLNQPDREA